jgi:hypothetical protein
MNLPHLPVLAPEAYLAAASALAGITIGALIMWGLVARRVARTTRNERRLEDALTFIVAAIAAGVSAQGMWMFFRDVLDFHVALRIVSFAVLEIAALTCGLRARRNVADPAIGEAGIDGAAVWAIAALSAVFSALDSHSVAEVPARLAFPLLAAWLWERGLSIERRKNTGRKVHMRITTDRILVRLGIAEPTDRTAFEVDAHRRLTAVAKAAMRLRARRAAGSWKWRQNFARLSLERAVQRAVEHSGLATNPERQAALVAQIGALVNASELAALDARAPWTPALRAPGSGAQAGPSTLDDQLDAATAEAPVPAAASTTCAPETTSNRPPVVMTPLGGLSMARIPTTRATDRPADQPQTINGTGAQVPGDHPIDRPEPPSSDHPIGRPATTETTTSKPVAKSTRTTARNLPAKKQKGRPTAEENAKAVTRYRASVAAKAPLSERDLAREFGRSKGWARDRIQEAGPQLVGGRPATTETTTANDHPNDQETTTEAVNQ